MERSWKILLIMRIKNIVKNGNYTGISRVQDLTLEMLSDDSSGETEATTEN